HACARGACDELACAAVDVRIVLVKPAARQELPALKAASFSGYLVKPVRAASLAARLVATELGFDHVPPVADENAAGEPPCIPDGLAILLAEDNEINAPLARSLLTRLGHRVTLATSGAAAFHAWLAAP